MFQQLNHTEDTLIVSVAMVLAGMIISRAINKLTNLIKELKTAKDEENDLRSDQLSRFEDYSDSL